MTNWPCGCARLLVVVHDTTSPVRSNVCPRHVCAVILNFGWNCVTCRDIRPHLPRQRLVEATIPFHCVRRFSTPKPCLRASFALTQPECLRTFAWLVHSRYRTVAHNSFDF